MYTFEDYWSFFTIDWIRYIHGKLDINLKLCCISIAALQYLIAMISLENRKIAYYTDIAWGFIVQKSCIGWTVTVQSFYTLSLMQHAL